METNPTLLATMTTRWLITDNGEINNYRRRGGEQWQRCSSSSPSSHHHHHIITLDFETILFLLLLPLLSHDPEQRRRGSSTLQIFSDSPGYDFSGAFILGLTTHPDFLPLDVTATSRTTANVRRRTVKACEILPKREVHPMLKVSDNSIFS
jgi:hypothetical protein